MSCPICLRDTSELYCYHPVDGNHHWRDNEGRQKHDQQQQQQQQQRAGCCMVCGPCQHAFCIDCMERLLSYHYDHREKRRRTRRNGSITAAAADHRSSRSHRLRGSDLNATTGTNERSIATIITDKYGFDCPLCRCHIPVEKVYVYGDEEFHSDDKDDENKARDQENAWLVSRLEAACTTRIANGYGSTMTGTAAEAEAEAAIAATAVGNQRSSGSSSSTTTTNGLGSSSLQEDEDVANRTARLYEAIRNCRNRLCKIVSLWCWIFMIIAVFVPVFIALLYGLFWCLEFILLGNDDDEDKSTDVSSKGQQFQWLTKSSSIGQEQEQQHQEEEEADDVDYGDDDARTIAFRIILCLVAAMFWSGACLAVARISVHRRVQQHRQQLLLFAPMTTTMSTPAGWNSRFVGGGGVHYVPAYYY